MNIADIAQPEPKSEAWLQIKDGIRLRVRYISKPQIQRMARNSMTRAYDPAKKRHVDNFNQEAFLGRLLEASVTGWEGITPRTLSSMIEVDTAKVPENQMDSPVPFTQANMLYLATNAFDIEETIQNFVTDRENFNASLGDELKN